MVRDLAFIRIKKGESIIYIFVFGGFPSKIQSDVWMLLMRSYQDRHETDMRFDIEVTQDSGPQNMPKENIRDELDHPKRANTPCLDQSYMSKVMI